MTTYNYNSELIKAMNEKLPNGTNLANTLIDMLYLGKEAVYRRLRGEVPFTLAEADLPKNGSIAGQTGRDECVFKCYI